MADPNKSDKKDLKKIIQKGLLRKEIMNELVSMLRVIFQIRNNFRIIYDIGNFFEEVEKIRPDDEDINKILDDEEMNKILSLLPQDIVSKIEINADDKTYRVLIKEVLNVYDAEKDTFEDLKIRFLELSYVMTFFLEDSERNEFIELATKFDQIQDDLEYEEFDKLISSVEDYLRKIITTIH